MKKTAKFIFNTIRNLSLLIVIGVVCVIVYFANNKMAAKDLIASWNGNNNYNQSEQANQLTVNQGFDAMAIDEPSLESYKSKKFKIVVKGGYAYLRPSQIMYINSNPIEIILPDDTKIEPKMKLFELDELLESNNETTFFRIRTAIINCNYIQQLSEESSKHNGSYSYQNVVIMEDGERINISKPKASELFKILDKLTF